MYIQHHQRLSRFNPLQVQAKLLPFKFLIVEVVAVSIPYRYKQNSVNYDSYISFWFCFNPLQVQTKPYYVAYCSEYVYQFQSPIGTNKTKQKFQLHGTSKSFNPLQVQTKRFTSAIGHQGTAESQSPIGTNKNQGFALLEIR